MGVRLADYIGVTNNNLPTVLFFFIIIILFFLLLNQQVYIIKVSNGRDMKKYKIEAEITKENLI